MSRDRVMQAVQSGDLDALDALLSQDSEWARGTPNAGWLAAQSGRADVLQVIGRHHPSSLVELSNGLTPATAAALAGHLGVDPTLAFHVLRHLAATDRVTVEGLGLDQRFGVGGGSRT